MQSGVEGSMQEIIETIAEKLSFDKKDKVIQLLSRCISECTESGKRTTAMYDNVVIKVGPLLDAISKFLNDVPKINKFNFGVESIDIIFNELGLEIDKEDAFLIYHLRDLGKFKIRESKLKEELNILWKEHKEYVLDDQEFSRTLKVLMRMGILDYRKGNLTLKNEILIRYKN